MVSKILRIDDRLIHGQVTVGWGSYYPIKKYVVLDDEIATNEWEKQLLLMAVPEHLEAAILTVAQGADYIQSHLHSSLFEMFLVSSPFQIQELDELGLPIKTINVGGIHYREGRRQILNYLFLSQEEIQTFQKLMAKGYVFECQDVPTNAKINLKTLLDKKK